MKFIKHLTLTLTEAAAVISKHFNLSATDSVKIQIEFSPEVVAQVKALYPDTACAPSCVPSPHEPGMVLTVTEVRANFNALMSSVREHQTTGRVFNKIAFIKAVRKLSGMSLYEAKNYVERNYPNPVF